MPIKSPITGSFNTVLEKELLSSFFISEYKKQLKVGVGRFFIDIKNVGLYKCLDTGYRFFYPFSISGDDAFYQELEKFPWYYIDWKWEHGIAYDLIQEKEKVLEIGCARGSFLKKLSDKKSLTEGLEMNSGALQHCISMGLSVHSDLIENFSPKRPLFYDTVCSFQVLEHITSVKQFIESSLAVLKPGGRMIISVPNNDSLLFKTEEICLNMPPHHMGRWNINSLLQLQNYFNMKIDAIFLEPLQKYHIGFAEKMSDKRVEEKLRKKLGVLAPTAEPFAVRLAHLGVSSVAEHIIGHSVLAVFKKNER